MIEGNRVYIPCIYVMNKIDAITMEELDLLDRIPHVCPISAHLEWNFDQASSFRALAGGCFLRLSADAGRNRSHGLC